MDRLHRCGYRLNDSVSFMVYNGMDKRACVPIETIHEQPAFAVRQGINKLVELKGFEVIDDDGD